MDKRTKKFAIGAVVAAAAGYVAGILTAPKSGKETREDIKDTAVKTYKTAEKELKELHTELNKLMGEASKKATELKGTAQQNMDKAVAGAKVAKEKARELLSAAHEGNAEDKDLDNAVKEAKKAVDHLKNYLKK
jgi:gas vesicle protein